MTSPAGEQAAATVKAVQSNAASLGLIWKLSTGTVRGGSDPSAIVVAMDGDQNAPVPAISMIGFITAGRRVFVIEIPGGGLYIVGYGGPDPHGTLRGEVGSELVSFTTLTQSTVAVTFDRPFDSIPAVTTNINSGSGSTANWSSRAFGISTTGFTLFVYGSGATSTWASIEVQWVATANP